MTERQNWKRIKLYQEEDGPEGNADAGARGGTGKGSRKCVEGQAGEGAWKGGPGGSTYLIAQEDSEVERRKQLLYDVLGPVFFGEEKAEDAAGLAALFRRRYGIDVGGDFCEGDEHYEEYQEASQAIAEGMSVYGGEIPFGDSALADLAEDLWEKLESKDGASFRRINTMLEE